MRLGPRLLLPTTPCGSEAWTVNRKGTYLLEVCYNNLAPTGKITKVTTVITISLMLSSVQLLSCV